MPTSSESNKLCETPLCKISALGRRKLSNYFGTAGIHFDISVEISAILHAPAILLTSTYRNVRNNAVAIPLACTGYFVKRDVAAMLLLYMQCLCERRGSHQHQGYTVCYRRSEAIDYQKRLVGSLP